MSFLADFVGGPYDGQLTAMEDDYPPPLIHVAKLEEPYWMGEEMPPLRAMTPRTLVYRRIHERSIPPHTPGTLGALERGDLRVAGAVRYAFDGEA